MTMRDVYPELLRTDDEPEIICPECGAEMASDGRIVCRCPICNLSLEVEADCEIEVLDLKDSDKGAPVAEEGALMEAAE